MKKLYIFFYIVLFQFSIFSITIKITDINNYPLKLQFNLEAGVEIEGRSNSGTGKMDYNNIFLRPSFFIDKFGIGFDLKLRFLQFPNTLKFNEKDWEIKTDTNESLYSFINKINFVRFATKYYPIYFTTGKSPSIKAGNGLLINSLNNNTFSPGMKEHGVYSFFNGHLFKYKIPFKGLFFISDIADPDIISFGGTFDIDYFINNDLFYLNAGVYTTMDLDSTESNAFSATFIDEIKGYRNTTFDSHTIGLTFPIESKFDFKIAQLRVLSETSFIYKNKSDGTYDASQFIGIRGDFVNIDNSGYIVGIPFGITIKSDGFYPGYFSENYQSTRKSQFENNLKYGNLFFNYGIYLSGYDDNLLFTLLLYSPFNMEYFTAGYEAGFYFNGTDSNLMKGLDINVKYRSSMEQLNINGDGGFFMHSITKDFRFSFEIGYNIYSTRISFLAGVQRANWVNSEFDNYKYEYTAENEYGISYVTNTVILMDKFGKTLDKFMQLEVSFAF